MFFIGTPVIQSAEEAMRFKLSWPDFATHDPIKDVIVQHTIQTQQQHKYASSPDGEKEGGSGSGIKGLPSSVSTSAISELAASPAVQVPSGCPFSGGMNSGTNTPVTVPPNLPSLAPSPKEHSKKKNVLQSLFGSKIPKGVDGGLSSERRDSSNNLTSVNGSKIAVPAPSEWKKSTAALGLPTHGNNSNENIPMLVSSSANPLNSLHSSGSYDTSSTSATLQPSSSSNGVASSSSGSHINFQPMQLSPSVEDRFTKKFHELMWEDACHGFHITIDLLKHFHTSNDSYCEVTQIPVFERVKKLTPLLRTSIWRW